MEIISVIVITYNSSKTVIDTLESIKNQDTIGPIELIITDDASSDNTLSVCNEWISKNLRRFEKVIVVSSEKNTGIASNLNRGILKATGDWVKIIAGDDLLLPDCLSGNLAFVSETNAEIVTSRIIPFYSRKMQFFADRRFDSEYKKNAFFFEMSPSKQYKKLLSGNYCSAPSGFYRREAILGIGLFNEKYPMYEDYPMWLKLTQKGLKIWFFNKETVLYRLTESVTRTTVKWVNLAFLDSEYRHFKDKIFPNLNLLIIINQWDKIVRLFSLKLILKIFGNTKNRKSQFVYKIVTLFLNPVLYYKKIMFGKSSVVSKNEMIDIKTGARIG